MVMPGQKFEDGSDATGVVAQMFNAMQSLPKDFGEAAEEVVIKDPSGLARASTKVRQMPRIRVYHLIYDNQNNIIDYHLDTWRISPGEAIAKLGTMTSAGLPVWVIKLPETLALEFENIPCRHPRCKAGPFRTIEDRELHVMAAHKQWRQQELERENREYQDRNIEMQRASQEALQSQAESMEKAAMTMAKSMERFTNFMQTFFKKQQQEDVLSEDDK